MAKTRYGCLVVALLMVMMLGSSAWAASISGTVQNYTGKSGRIYLTVNSQNGGSNNIGTSISSAGAFTINGVQSGSQYSIRAFVDTQGAGIQHANDPTGESFGVMATSGNVSVGTFEVSTPSAQAPQAPQFIVYRGSGANVMIWDGPQDNNGLPIADKYIISWSTSSSGSPVTGSKDVASGDKDFFAHFGGSSTLYYQITAVAGGSTTSSPWTPVSAPAGTGSVTGKVYFPGLTPTGPLFVLLADFSTDTPKFNVAAVASPASGGSYTASNVPAGTYEVYPFLDLNNSGTYDAGDVGVLDSSDFNARVTVATSQVTVADIALVNVDAATIITTNYGKSEWGEWYNINLNVQSMKKRVMNVQIISGPQISVPIDVAFDRDGFEAWFNVAARPTVGDIYQIKVTYSDSTFETVSKSVTAVLDGLATPLAPVGFISYNATPTFSWTAPSPAPAQYIYSIWVNENDSNNGSIWDVWGLPSSQTSIVYGSQGEVSQPQLTDGIAYNWTVTVTDSNGNQAQSQTSFTTTSAPAISGFSPAVGQAGTVVTISGINFNPNPSSNSVLFSGVTAIVTAATSTSLTVTVPNGATTGKIQVGTVQSTKDFIIGATATIQGFVKTSGETAPIAGARVEKVDDSSVYTTTAADGSFTLNWVQNQNIAFKITKAGYVPTYTGYFGLNGNLDLRPHPSHLYTQAELTAWEVTAGKGVIVGRAMNMGTTPYTPVGGVVVTAQGSIFYPVTYYSGTAFGGSATYSNGIYFVKNVDPNQWVNVNASKSSWNFYNSTYLIYANSVTEGGISGFTQPPYINSIYPTTGKAGTSVTIYGNNFSAVQAENSVTFNGVPATVDSATTISLSVTVPAEATTGQISITTAGGSNTYWQTFTMRNTLTASVAGSVGGTVTSVPGGISCRTLTGCTEDFDQGTPVQLVATADAGSFLSAWSGACTGTGDCNFTMDANKSVIATFAELQYIMNGTNYYSLLQNAFDGAANGNTIQVQAEIFTDPDLVFNKATNVQVKFKGGYDNSFNTYGGYSTLDGKLSVRGGTLRVEKFKIK